MTMALPLSHAASLFFETQEWNQAEMWQLNI